MRKKKLHESMSLEQMASCCTYPQQFLPFLMGSSSWVEEGGITVVTGAPRSKAPQGSHIAQLPTRRPILKRCAHFAKGAEVR